MDVGLNGPLSCMEAGIVIIFLKWWQLIKTVIDAAATFKHRRLMSYIQTRKFIFRVNRAA